MNDTLNNFKIAPNLNAFRDRIFAGVIGQENPKKELSFYLDSYQVTRIMPHLAIIAPKGQGKTKIARSIGKGLYQFDEEGRAMFQPSVKDPNILVPKRKTFLEVNCSTIKNLESFINGVIIKSVVDRDVTIFFDEASEIPHDVSMALLSMLENNANHKTQFTYKEYTCDIDFRRQTFIFATTESQKVFHALMDRCERISLQEYTHQDLADIVKINLPDVLTEDSLLLEISSVLRGNARAANKMADKIMTYLKGDKIFMREDWEELKKILSIAPLGLNAIELQVLRYLQENPNGTSLTAMSARTGMSREQLRQDSELYLLKFGLMEINTAGRQITAKGIQYLKELDGK